MALPSACAPSARRWARPPTPRRVRRFWNQTAASPGYRPASISTMSPSRATLAAALGVLSGCCGPTFSTAPALAIGTARSRASDSATRLAGVAHGYRRRMGRDVGVHRGKEDLVYPAPAEIAQQPAQARLRPVEVHVIPEPCPHAG